jgi:hypothetical protein
MLSCYATIFSALTPVVGVVIGRGKPFTLQDVISAHGSDPQTWAGWPELQLAYTEREVQYPATISDYAMIAAGQDVGRILKDVVLGQYGKFCEIGPYIGRKRSYVPKGGTP